MNHHETEAAQESSGHGEICVLAVLSQCLIGCFEVFRTMSPYFIGSLDEMVLEDTVAGGERLALIGIFVWTSTLLAARNHSGIGA